MAVYYEWCLEVSEDGEVIDSDFRDKLSEFSSLQGELCLVRRSGSESAGETDRVWAYVNEGRLPEYFSDSLGNVLGIRVPARFHKELNNNL